MVDDPKSGDFFDSVAKNQIGKIVAFVLTPILLPLVGNVANWVQDVLGLDLSGADLTAYIVSVIAGVALVAYQWLRNRGRWEVAAAELARVKRMGDEVMSGATGSETTLRRP